MNIHEVTAKSYNRRNLFLTIMYFYSADLEIVLAFLAAGVHAIKLSVQKCKKLSKIGQKLSKIGQKLSKMGPKMSKMIQMLSKFIKSLNYFCQLR